QSLGRQGVVDECVADYGQLIVDECHHLSARSFEQAARQAKARFVAGLSATIARKDGHHPIIFMQCGPVRHRVDARAQAAARPFEHRVLVRPTAFRSLKVPETEKRLEFQALYQALIDDDARTRLICEDVVDSARAGRSPMLARMFDRRCRGYEAIGYAVVLPASAIPGWPADVVLPADPVWKRDYSGSVRRLVRDAVDAPLASLFLHATRTVHADAEGADRARSATEAFLFRRLETLAATKGRFRLNERLPIAFDPTGALEADLLCADARMAIELDGA